MTDGVLMEVHSIVCPCYPGAILLKDVLQQLKVPKRACVAWLALSGSCSSRRVARAACIAWLVRLASRGSHRARLSPPQAKIVGLFTARKTPRCNLAIEFSF